MAYIGKSPQYGSYSKLDTPTFNGVSTTFNLTVNSNPVTPGSAQNLLLSLDGVIQNPGVDFTVSTNTITFTVAPTAGQNFFCILLGDVMSIGTPSDGTVTTPKLADGSVTDAKIVNADWTKLTGSTAVTMPANSTAAGLKGSSATVAAAGANQATATALTADINVVTSGTGGVQVPGAASGKYVVIANSSGATITVYPSNGHQFDALGANTGITLLNGNMIEIYGSSTTQWTTTLNAQINVSAINATGTPNSSTILYGDGSWKTLNVASNTQITYANRAILRTTEGPSSQTATVESLGLFTWSAGITEIDDDETCFVSSTGQWQLVAADPDFGFSLWYPEYNELKNRIVDQFIYYTFNQTVTSLAAATYNLYYTLTVPNASVNDTVIVTPNGATYCTISAVVSSANTVQIYFGNSGAGAVNISSGTWNILVIKKDTTWV